MDANIAVTQITAAAVAAWGIQKLKESPYFPWISHTTSKWRARGASMISAIGIHTGISHVWAPEAATGGYILILHLPPIWDMVVTLWHWLGQYVMQEGWYQAAFNKVTITSDPTGPTIPVKVDSTGAVVVPAKP